MNISAIVPTLNEARYIGGIIEVFLKNAPQPSEIFVVDGGSTDGTQQVVNDLKAKYSNVHWVSNPKRYVSPGFNACFPQTSGKYVCLLGAHARYDDAYFTTCFNALEAGEADVAGGFLLQEGQGAFGQALAFAMSSKAGVGNTEFRTIRKRMLVDSVAFAVYRRTIFETTGLLDESLVRNQDDELHYRINAHGFKILMIPDVTSTYQVRSTPQALWRQYFDYGYYKPLVIQKVKGSVRLRHLIPALFVLYLFSLPLAFFWWPWALPIAAYLVLIGAVSGKGVDSLKSFLNRILAFVTLHTSYGAGFIKGIFKFYL
jgi:glycosyltransferase involved in cell wall biosynthesis